MLLSSASTTSVVSSWASETGGNANVVLSDASVVWLSATAGEVGSRGAAVTTLYTAPVDNKTPSAVLSAASAWVAATVDTATHQRAGNNDVGSVGNTIFLSGTSKRRGHITSLGPSLITERRVMLPTLFIARRCESV